MRGDSIVTPHDARSAAKDRSIYSWIHTSCLRFRHYYYLTNTMKIATLFALLSLAVPVGAQLNYLDQPQVAWTKSLAPIEEGNAVTVSPDGGVVYATSANGNLGLLSSANGDIIKVYEPTQNGDHLPGCESGVAFGESMNLGSFVVYAITDGINTLSEFCRIAAVSHPLGEELWLSDPLPGACAGDPKLSSDGEHVFVNHNSDARTVGYFSVLQTALTGTVLFTSQGDTTQPFGPLGIFHDPVQGAYEGGLGNSNDILLWAYQPKPGETTIDNGGTFAFQFPFPSSLPLTIKTLLPNVDRDIPSPDWQVVSAPAITNQGLTSYFTVSRSEFRVWNGAVGTKGAYFDRRASANQRGFEAGFPRSNPGQTTLTLSSDPVEPQVFGGVASKFFVSMDFQLAILWENPTFSIVMAEGRVSPDDSRVYYAEQNGIIYSALTSNGTVNWDVPIGSFTLSDFSLSSSGDYLYYGDTLGNVVAWQIATPPPTASPSDAPTSAPSTTPSKAPTAATSAPSTFTTTEAPSPDTGMIQTNAPTAGPTPVVSAPSSGTPSPTSIETSSGATMVAGFSAIAWAFVAAILV